MNEAHHQDLSPVTSPCFCRRSQCCCATWPVLLAVALICVASASAQPRRFAPDLKLSTIGMSGEEDNFSSVFGRRLASDSKLRAARLDAATAAIQTAEHALDIAQSLLEQDLPFTTEGNTAQPAAGKESLWSRTWAALRGLLGPLCLDEKDSRASAVYLLSEWLTLPPCRALGAGPAASASADAAPRDAAARQTGSEASAYYVDTGALADSDSDRPVLQLLLTPHVQASYRVHMRIPHYNTTATCGLAGVLTCSLTDIALCVCCTTTQASLRHIRQRYNSLGRGHDRRLQQRGPQPQGKPGPDLNLPPLPEPTYINVPGTRKAVHCFTLTRSNYNQRHAALCIPCAHVDSYVFACSAAEGRLCPVPDIRIRACVRVCRCVQATSGLRRTPEQAKQTCAWVPRSGPLSAFSSPPRHSPAPRHLRHQAFPPQLRHQVSDA